MKARWKMVATAGAAMLLLGSLTFLQAQGEATPAEPTVATVALSDTVPAYMGSGEHPIAFPHDLHAGENQIDCKYCHFSAERSSSAGIPPVATCMGCHLFVQGRTNPEQIDILRGFADRGEAIPWVRIYKVAEHVQFPHMRHIAAGVDCTECHGQVQEMGVITQVNQPLTMGWCLDCHVTRDASRDCTVCHY